MKKKVYQNKLILLFLFFHELLLELLAEFLEELMLVLCSICASTHLVPKKAGSCWFNECPSS